MPSFHSRRKSASSAIEMAAVQLTNGSSTRIRPRARVRASGTAWPAAFRDRPTRGSAGAGAGVVTVGNSTFPITDMIGT